MTMVSAEVAQQAPLIETTAGESSRLSSGACFVARFALEHSIAWDSDTMQPHEVADTLGVIADAYTFAQDAGHRYWQGRHGKLAGQGAAILQAIQLGQPVAAFRKEHALTVNRHYNEWLSRAHHYGGIFYAEYAAACPQDPRLGRAAQTNPLLKVLCEGGMERSDAALAVLMAQKAPAWIAQAFGERTAKSLREISDKSMSIAADAEEYDPLSFYLRPVTTVLPAPREPSSSKPPRPIRTGVLHEPESEKRLLTAEEEVILAKRIEAGVFARKVLEQLTATGQTGKMVSGKYVLLQDFELVAKDGKDAFNRFLEANTGLINRMLNSGQIQNALRTEGLVLDESTRAAIIQDVQYNQREGLWHAIEKFDFTQGYKFSTYAYNNWVRRGVYAAIASELGYNLVGNDFEALQRVRRQMYNPEQCDLPLKERAKLLALQPSKLRALEAIALRGTRMPSLDALIRGENGEDTFTLGDTIVKPTPLPISSVDATTKQLLAQALETLTPREHELIMNRFGSSTQVYSHAELARRHGCSQSSIETSYSRGIQKLRKFLGARLPHLAQIETSLSA